MKNELSERESGLTLVEVTVTLVVFTALSIVVMQILAGISASQQYVEGNLRAKSLAERIAQSIKVDVGFIARMFEEGDEGRYYLDRIEAMDRSPLAESRMPVTSSLGYFEADPVDEIQTGNLLFFARHVKPRVMDVSTTATPDLQRVDRFSFVLYFLSEGSGALDLNRWASVPLVRYRDIVSIEDGARRRRLAVALYDDGARFAWDIGKDHLQSLFRIEVDGRLVAFKTGERVPAEPSEVDMAIVSRRHFQIVRNGQRSPMVVPQYAREHPAFPHGFELKIDGAAAGGLLLVRFVIETTTERRKSRALAQRTVAFRGE